MEPLYSIYMPLGIVGFIRWSIWIFKKILSFGYAPSVLKNKERFTFSIVTAVYNEDPAFFKKALLSWKRNKPTEIIAVIDYSDWRDINLFKKFSENFKEAKLIITTCPGKRPALALGIKASKGRIVAMADSDTVWDKKIKHKIFNSFADESVGGVTLRQEVLEPDTLNRRLYNIQLSDRYFTEFPFLSVVSNYLNCLSGRTAVYRREALLQVIDDMVNEKFLAERSISGEDKALTNLIQKSGWKTRYVMDACVKTSGAPDFETFLKQRIRWSRNSWRADIKMIFSKWIWKRGKVLALYTIDRFIQPFIFLVAPITFLFAVTRGDWPIAGGLILWWIISRSVKISSHLKRHPADFAIVPIYILNNYLLNVIKIYALFTITRQGWITRWDQRRVKSFSWIKSVPAYFLTFFVLILFFILIGSRNGNVEGFLKDEIYLNKNDADRELILNNLNNNQFAYYELKEGDDAESISARYGVEKEKIWIFENNAVIPISELRRSPEQIFSYNTPQIFYDREKNLITIKGEGSIVTMGMLWDVLKDEGLFVKNSKEWLLKSDILVLKGAVLLIFSEDVSLLKLKSDQDGFVSINSDNGNIVISGTSIISWDEKKAGPDIETGDGRSFILVKGNARLDVIGSEIAYLGYENPQRCALNWSSKERFLTVGSLNRSSVHDNYCGAGLSGTTGISVINSDIFSNSNEGLFLDGSNNSLVFNNEIYSNGKEGICLEKNSFNNFIISNKIYENKSDGISFNKDSVNNFAKENYIFSNSSGILISRSRHNLAEGNIIKDNEIGIFIKNQNENQENNSFYRNIIVNNKINVEN
ncbi:MAG: glycosyltransferase [bacterium]|nr:glycosyltransferase [bacterium]